MPRPRKPASPFRYFNSSPEVIRLAVLMYVKYPLSLRNVEDLLAERGIDISHETIRYWWNRFGPLFAGDVRRQRASRMRGYRQWQWHLDEMYVKVNGEMRYLWQAVDHEGEVLESFVTKERDKAAALKFMKKAMKRFGKPEAVTTDGLRSYKAAMHELGNADRQHIGRWANNRVENSHLPFRRRERAMLRFRQMKTLQKFASVHANVHNHSTPNATSSIDPLTKHFARPPWPSGSRCSPKPAHQRPNCANRRIVRISLTAPAGTVSYILTDQVGQPQKMLNGSGAGSRSLVSWADTVSQPAGSTSANPLRFPGQWYDANAGGLHYNDFRDYDPAAERHLDTDPIGLNGDSTHTPM